MEPLNINSFHLQVSMTESVQSIVSAIHMIYRVSLYYNTIEKISVLFIQVSEACLTKKQVSCILKIILS